MEPEMHATPESSTIAEIGYDEVNEEVWARFTSGNLYVYSGVPPVVWEDFFGAPSKGSFLNQVLRPGYPYRRA